MKTILLVEDDDIVKNVMSHLLGENADRILSAGHGEEALEVSKEHQGRIDLLIVDVVLPGMNGPELAENLRSSHPEIQVLYMSAYPDEVIREYGVLDQNFIRKPFDLNNLEAEVNSLLNG